MNQDFHILCGILGAYKVNNSKEQTLKYIKNNVAAMEIMDSFRARLDRQITHFVSGSYWKMPETMEEVKKSKKEDMQSHLSEESKISQGYCVNGLMDFKNLVKNNIGLFNEKNIDEYGKPVLVHSLQDFYTDIVWRLMYNFENQGKIILKTEEPVQFVDSDVTPDDIDRSKKAEYTKLDENLKKSDQRFREEYKTINCYASLFLAKKLQNLGFDIWNDEENNIFSDLAPYVIEKYPEDVYAGSGKYMNFQPETKEAMTDDEKAEELRSQIRQIFGGNADLFIKSMENCINSSEEADRIANEIARCSRQGTISDEDLDRIFSRQLRITKNPI